MLNELKTRGIKDVFLFCVDGLTGFRQTIEAAFPNAQIQRCIIHQIRSSTRFVSYKHIKELIFYDIFIVKIEAHYCSSQIYKSLSITVYSGLHYLLISGFRYTI